MDSYNGYCSDSKNGFDCWIYCQNTTDTANHCYCKGPKLHTKYITEKMFNLNSNINLAFKSLQNTIKNCFSQNGDDQIRRITCTFFNNDNNSSNPISVCEIAKKMKQKDRIFFSRDSLLNSEYFGKSTFLSSIFSDYEDDAVIPGILCMFFILLFVFLFLGYVLYTKWKESNGRRDRRVHGDNIELLSRRN